MISRRHDNICQLDILILTENFFKVATAPRVTERVLQRLARRCSDRGDVINLIR